MISRLLKILIAVTILLPQTLYAAEINLESQTYFSLIEDEVGKDARDVGTLYEYLSLDVTGENYSFVFSGWGRTQTMDDRIGFEDDENEDGDFSAAYLDYTSEHSNFNIRLGKQTVLSHKSYESLSGISLRTDLPFHLKLSAFSGVPEELEEKSASGDLLSGGRIAIGKAGLLELGVSYLEETDDDKQYRRELGADLWIMPVSRLELYGETVGNRITGSDAYSSVEANFYATDKITISGKYEKINYKGYFLNPEVGIFSHLGSKEKLETTDWGISYAVNDSISIRIDGKDYSFDQPQTKGAKSFGGGLKVTKDSTISEVSYHKTDSEDLSEGYFNEYRAYVITTIKDDITLSCDAIMETFEKKVNNNDTSLSVIASAGYQVTDSLAVSVDLDYSETPAYEDDYKLFARIEYNFGTSYEFSSGDDEDKEEAAATPVPEEEPVKEPVPVPVAPPKAITPPVPPVVTPPAPKAFPMRELAPGEKPYTVIDLEPEPEQK